MSDQTPNGYERLLEIAKNKQDKLDSFILELLEILSNNEQDIEVFAFPIIVQFQKNSLVAWEKYGTLMEMEIPEPTFHMDSMIALRANPEQLAKLMLLPDVLKIFALRKKRSNN